MIVVFNDKFVKGWRPSTMPARGKVLTVAEALSATYETDAHFVCYVPREGAPPVRVLKDAPRPGEYETHVLVADVDNNPHVAWTAEGIAKWRALVPSLPILDTAAVYLTSKGWRIIQPLAEPILSTDVERYTLGWFDELADYGITADPACKDWTRMMRLPNILRDGVPFSTPFMSLERMRPRPIEPRPPNRQRAGAASAARNCPGLWSAGVGVGGRMALPGRARGEGGGHRRRREQLPRAGARARGVLPLERRACGDGARVR